MAKNYIEYQFTNSPSDSEILIAELALLGFEGFEETEAGLLAYIPQEKDHKGILKNVNLLNSEETDINYKTKTITAQNWNKQWESDFKPIEVADLCRIRAPFHEKKSFTYDIIINPKMAFGTGHHATTYLMINFLLNENLKQKKVLDMGCGTGVLAILSSLKHAKKVEAIDIDQWSYENTIENIGLNRVKNISVFQGDATLLSNKHYDVILANINRNTLLEDMERYAQCLSNGGLLFLSGFYKQDLPKIDQRASEFDLKITAKQTRKEWMGLQYTKNML